MKTLTLQRRSKDTEDHTRRGFTQQRKGCTVGHLLKVQQTLGNRFLQSIAEKTSDNSVCDHVPTPIYEVLRTPGQPLDPAIRTFMEARFAHELRSVRVHSDTTAARSAQLCGALGYTVGKHVVLGEGSPTNSRAAGIESLAHELAHALQQEGPTRPTDAKLVIDHSDSSEAEAEAASRAVVSGQQVPPLHSRTYPGLQFRKRRDHEPSRPRTELRVNGRNSSVEAARQMGQDILVLARNGSEFRSLFEYCLEFFIGDASIAFLFATMEAARVRARHIVQIASAGGDFESAFTYWFELFGDEGEVQMALLNALAMDNELPTTYQGKETPIEEERISGVLRPESWVFPISEPKVEDDAMTITYFATIIAETSESVSVELYSDVSAGGELSVKVPLEIVEVKLGGAARAGMKMAARSEEKSLQRVGTTVSKTFVVQRISRQVILAEWMRKLYGYGLGREDLSVLPKARFAERTKVESPVVFPVQNQQGYQIVPQGKGSPLGRFWFVFSHEHQNKEPAWQMVWRQLEAERERFPIDVVHGPGSVTLPTRDWP